MNESTRLINHLMIGNTRECRVIERNALFGHHARIDYLLVDCHEKASEAVYHEAKRRFYAWVRGRS
ncbi:MAG: hypothetical protein JW878_06220 [Methanomicrobia archaeon]|nr:hypothetical protein [Methanomicrobia archaeon]